MVCDVLCLADPYFRIPVRTEDFQKKYLPRKKSVHESLPPSLAVLDIRAFERMKDSIIDQIATTTDPRLRDARALIYRFQTRDFYKLAYTKLLDMNNPGHQNVWSMEAPEIKRLVLDQHCVHGTDDGGSIPLAIENFTVDKCSTHHGAKDGNPQDNIRFVRKSDLFKLSKPKAEWPVAIKIESLE